VGVGAEAGVEEAAMGVEVVVVVVAVAEAATVPLPLGARSMCVPTQPRSTSPGLIRIGLFTVQPRTAFYHRSIFQPRYGSRRWFTN
jgi:hypothetical protein